MEKKVVTKEELETITTLRKKAADLTVTLGQIETQIMSLTLDKEAIKKVFIELRAEEQAISTQLKEKYGDGQFSLETGEFTS